MELFKELNPILEDCNLKLIITKKEGKMSVVVQPYSLKEDIPQIVPIMMTGTPEELDTRFIGIIKEPLQKTAEFFHNSESVDKSISEAKESVKKPSGTKKSTAKPATPAPAPPPPKPAETDLFSGLPATESIPKPPSAMPKQEIPPNKDFDKKEEKVEEIVEDQDW